MTIDSLLVIADAHLRADSGADEEAFLALLDTAAGRADALLLAGDIYDFWFAYKQLIPRDCARVTARIIELATRMPLFMLGGNHDRWGDAFWSQAGVRFGREFALQVGDRSVLALHGDGLHEERNTAAALNRLLDARWVQRAFEWLPPVAGFGIARRLGHKPGFAVAHPEVVDTAAARQLAWATHRFEVDPGLDTLIMAHTHRPALVEVSPGKWYVNPGPWLAEHRFATVTGSAVELHVFS